MRVPQRLLRVFVLVVLAALLPMQTSRAAFHIVMVVEVFPGTAAAPNAQFVELQMFAAGQNFVAGHSVQIFNAAGAAVGTFTFELPNPSNGADQATILLATPEAQVLFGVTDDYEAMTPMTPVIDAAGGKVCFDGPFPPDCVGWGSYALGDPTVGTPFSPAGLALGASAQRRIDRGDPATLDFLDDTNNSAADFVSAGPTPRNNAGTTGVGPGYGSTPAAPGPVVFPPVTTGTSSPGGFQIQETGTATLTVSNPTLGGSHAGDFEVLTAFPLTIVNGGAAQTVQLTCTPSADGSRSATLTVSTNDQARPTVVYNLSCTGVAPPPGLVFHTVEPCRVVDTRAAAGGPVVAGVDRTFTIVGLACGIPPTTRAVSLNLAVTQPTAAGNVRLYPADAAVPTVSSINYAAGRTRSNNAVVGLSAGGELKVRAQPTGTVHVILDVNGYFDDNACAGAGAPCDTGEPGACGPGTTVCDSGGLICSRLSSPSPIEICNNGLDDDCNGVTDEGCP